MGLHVKIFIMEVSIQARGGPHLQLCRHVFECARVCHCGVSHAQHTNAAPSDGKDNRREDAADLGHDLYDWILGPSKHLSENIHGSISDDDMFWLKLPDMFVAALQIPLLCVLVAHPKRLQIVRRLAFVWGFVSLLRGVCVAVTSLPDASPMCTSQFGNPKTGLYKGQPMFPKAFKRALSIVLKPGVHVTCGDMVFSGHTVFYMLVCMIFHTYMTWENCNTPFMRSIPRWIPVHALLRWLVYVVAFCAMCATVGTRLHYTLDVVAAVYLTRRSWDSYISRCHSSRKNASHILIRWLEDDDVILADESAYIKSRDRTSSILE